MTRTRAQQRAAAPGNRLKGDIQATSVSGFNFGKLGNWWRGRWGARGSFTQWQLMPPWRRVACHVLPIIIAGLLGVAAVQLVGDRYHPRIILGQQVVPNVVAPGAVVEVVYTAKDKRRCHGDVHRWLLDKDNRLYALPTVEVFYNYEGLPPSFEFVRDIVIPPSMPDGPATYHAETDRWCNTLQQAFWPIHDTNEAKFTVLRGAEQTPQPPLPAPVSLSPRSLMTPGG
jgi:hypothetical protein